MLAKCASVVCIVLASACVAKAQESKPTKPVNELTAQEWCAQAVVLLGNRHGDPFQKKALLEAMRNRGCLAAPQAAATSVYSVQVTSKRTEGEARAAYESLQSKYPDMFVGREASIRRADLGANGVVYRATVGQFSAANLAHDFCNRLKVVGGACVVQKD